MAEIIKLGAYRGIARPVGNIEVHDEEIESVLVQWQANAAVAEKADRAAKKGDIVVIDFRGMIDGVAFEGGTGENYSLELGSGTFIPGFEEQLIGASAGDHVDVTVSFPENYGAAELAGKEAVFACLIHEVQEKKAAELNDEFAGKVSPFATLAELRADMRKQMEAQRKRQDDENRFVEALKKVVAESEIHVTDEEVAEMQQAYLEAVQAELAQQGMSLENYLERLKKTEEEYKEEMLPHAKEDALFAAVLEEIARREDLEATEEDIEHEFEIMAQYTRLPIDELKKQLSSRVDHVRKSIIRDKVMKIIL
jgi:trigger factor